MGGEGEVEREEITLIFRVKNRYLAPAHEGTGTDVLTTGDFELHSCMG